MEFEAATKRREDEHNLVVMGAWYTAALSRQKKLPSLKQLLQRDDAATPTREQQLAVYQQLSEQHHLKLTVKKD